MVTEAGYASQPNRSVRSGLSAGQSGIRGNRLMLAWETKLLRLSFLRSASLRAGSFPRWLQGQDQRSP